MFLIKLLDSVVMSMSCQKGIGEEIISILNGNNQKIIDQVSLVLFDRQSISDSGRTKKFLRRGIFLAKLPVTMDAQLFRRNICAIQDYLVIDHQ